jgi:nicotinate-nucleotide adenylyltransferase
MGERAPIGVLGGTFDPIHHGHLRLAEEAADALALARVLLIPAALPNLRARPGTEPQHRLEMARLAVQGNARLEIDGRELARAGVSYTVDTLTELRAELGFERVLYLILGADAFLRLPDWNRWRMLFDLAHIAVATRPGYPLDQSLATVRELELEWRTRGIVGVEQSARTAAGKIIRVPIPLLEISATDLRARMSQGSSVHYLLPATVLDYIAAHCLYAVK